MNQNEDNPFSRWSQRKLEARSEKLSPSANTEPPSELPGDDDATALASDPASPDPPTEDPVEALPLLEDLTADSDVTAFLKKGVPLALKSAALRKMWSLDPGIRDFVGLSEYAWDFNKPGSMGGFGPLGEKETIVTFLSKTSRALQPESEYHPALPRSETSSEETDNGGMQAAPAGELASSSPEARSPEPAGPSTSTVVPEHSSGQPEPESAPRQISEKPDSQDFRPAARPRHGGAMPS